ncbi:hypothetical protein GM415_15540 [Pseudodesulfovibrio cashew]|uniref:Uncharacterized protein n=1 Tax=Pseudodesulfovibrio cashew TaxID=2678688 RepID=A0A6I6JJZ7_9BACT|nr:hypothetical protein [Pseudodesulfovibrio cashew]QGY41469.1 hypothetical protein GM415_15540 [Pseudodesulfovibrio cashew]
MEKVRHSCGCTKKYRLYGPAHSVRRQIEHREAMPCPKCKRAAEEAVFIATCEESALANTEMGLPELTGTAAQVAYAESIRRDGVRDALRMVNSDQEQDVIDTLSKATAAKWWLDNKELMFGAWTAKAKADFTA